MKLTFLGATETVTGSKFLLEAGGRRVLIDCGLFQGLKELRLRNWSAPPIDPATVDDIVLTHAHIDHTGYLPRFMRQGFSGRVFGTPATLDLCNILLPDSGHLQEEEAKFRNRHGYSKHKPALPLYTEQDAEEVLKLLKPAGYGVRHALSRSLSFELFPAGHILGSSFIRFSDGQRTVLFTGDIGRYDTPIIRDPSAISSADYLVMESTYGNRSHDDHDGESGKEKLRKIVVDTSNRGGTVLIPSFAVGRAQEILFILRELEDEGRIPVLPVYVDSPMAVNAMSVYLKHVDEHDSEMKQIQRGGAALSTERLSLVRSVEESKRINAHRFPSIIISANGMATGGRILHHLIDRVTDERNSVVFVGFQAAGTRGRLLSEGAKTIRIFGNDYPVRAAIHVLHGFSAHGDFTEMIRWLHGFESAPRKTFLVHGEPNALAAMSEHIHNNFQGWSVEIPKYLDTFELD